MDILQWFEKWANDNCNNELKDSQKINISALDNPGWSVKIKLINTKLFNKYYDTIDIDNGDNDWIVCRVVNSVFEGYGDTNKLYEILESFRKWENSKK